MEQQKYCPKCKSVLHDRESEFCYVDGTRLTTLPVHTCGRRLEAVDRFCPKCGEQVFHMVIAEAEREDIVKAERERQATERAERDAQLDADPEYKAWSDSL
jgi:ribosomal protein L33